MCRSLADNHCCIICISSDAFLRLFSEQYLSIIEVYVSLVVVWPNRTIELRSLSASAFCFCSTSILANFADKHVPCINTWLKIPIQHLIMEVIHESSLLIPFLNSTLRLFQDPKDRTNGLLLFSSCDRGGARQFDLGDEKN